MMGKSKGMTLIEVIISITLLGSIAIMMLPFFANNYKILINTRQIIKNAYTAQDNMEDQIKKVEDQIEKKSSNPTVVVDGTAHSYTIFSEPTDKRTVIGYDNEVAISSVDFLGTSNKKLFTVVVDTYSDGLPVATITSNTLKMLASGSEVSNAYANSSGLSLKTSAPVSDPAGVHLQNIYRWYVSKAGFYTATTVSPEENEKGTLYPVFPNDYTVIAGQETETLSADLQSYAGRYIVCTATPGSRQGKMGITVDSNPVYLSGLTVTDNLLLHMDASMINQDDTNYINTIGTTEYVLKWNSIGGPVNIATPVASSDIPSYMQSEVQSSDLSKKINFKYLGYTKNVKLITNNNINMTLNKFQAFVVVRNIDGATGNILSYENGWSLSPNSSGGVDFSVMDQSGNANVSVSSSTSIKDGAWHIIKLVSYVSGSESKLSISIDGGSESYSSGGVSSISADRKLTIGNNISGDIAEVILYNSTTIDSAKVIQYLSNKYRP